MKFYLGTHRPYWVWKHADRWPWFVSRRQLEKIKNLHPAKGPWALDSGGFTELAKHGQWTIDATTYTRQVRRYVDEIGQLQWAAPQDWMCEPSMLAKTGLTIPEHQRRTIENYLELRTVAADLPIIPVLQGWDADDYRRHVDAYARAGIDLPGEELVGLGTVCRRADVAPIQLLVAELAGAGLHIHGFGLKSDGIALFGEHLASSDSLAWSYYARQEAQKVIRAGGWGRRMCTTQHPGQSCANCRAWALEWARRATSTIHARQLAIDFPSPSLTSAAGQG